MSFYARGRSVPRAAPAAAAACAALLAAASPAFAVDAEWTRRWREDLETVRVEIPRAHANAFHTISIEEWNASIDDLSARAPSLEHHELIVELAKIIASIGDGHTRLTLPVDPGFGKAITHTPTEEPKAPGLRLHYLPVRMHVYEDGLRVREIDAAHAAHADAKVARIGRMTAEEAMAAVAPTIQHDNEQQIAARLPIHLMIPEVLHACGVTPDPASAEFEFLSAEGKRTTVTLRAVPYGEPVSWVGARAAGEPALYLRDPEKNFWFAELPEHQAVYVRLNQIQHMESETFPDFADRVFDAFDGGPARRLVLDVRGNPGGDGTLNQRLVHRAICSPKLKEPGSFFTVIDRGTFSAAMMLVTALEQNTGAIFVGEPTGARPNSYGDSRKTVLPNTGLTVRASTLYWQNSDPRDDRASTEPHVAVKQDARDDAANRDPALEMLARIWSQPCDVTGAWNGVATYRFHRFPVTLEFAKSDSGWEGWFSAPALEVERSSVAAIRVEGRVVSFDLPTPFGAIPSRVWLGGETMVGGGARNGESVLIAAHRE